MDEYEKMDSDQLVEKVISMTRSMQASLLEMIRTIFKRPRLNLDSDRLVALDVLSMPPFKGDDEEEQECLNKEYRESLALAMPLVRFLIPEVYTIKRQELMFEFIKANADEHASLSAKADIPVKTCASIILYDAGTLFYILDNPFMSLDDDDHRMLVVFRATLNL